LKRSEERLQEYAIKNREFQGLPCPDFGNTTQG